MVEYFWKQFLAFNFFRKKCPTINNWMCSKKASVAFKEKRNKLLYNFLKSYTILKMFPCFCFLFLCWVILCNGCFRQVLFSFGRQKKWSLVAWDRWSSYTVTIVWEFDGANSALVVLKEWSPYRGGRLNRFDCTIQTINHFVKNIWNFL